MLIHETVSKNELFQVKYLCEVAGVSRSGYYNYISEKSSKRRLEKFNQDVSTRDIILAVTKSEKFKMGARQIKMQLHSKFGIVMNLKKIFRIMKLFGIESGIRKANPYTKLANAIKENYYVPNLLNREFKPGTANTVLLTDITYIYYGKSRKLAYLSAIKDSQTQLIPAHNLSKSLQMPLVLDTIEKLIDNENFNVTSNTIIHSDQGVHYTSRSFRDALKFYGISRSMSRRGNCWDNAPMESFFSTLKQETYFKDIETFEELQEYINEYIHYYNYERPQWGIQKMTPMDYHRSHIQLQS